MTKRLAIFAAILLASMQMAKAQVVNDINRASDVSARVQSQFGSRYPALLLAKTTPDGADIAAAGTVLILQRDNLVLNKVYLGDTTNVSAPIQNVYDKGAITQVGILGALSNLTSFLSALSNTDAPDRTFSQGQKFWVTKISMASQLDGIVFDLMSDPVNDVRYHGALEFPFMKGNALDADQAVARIGEVLTPEEPAPTADSGANSIASLDPPPNESPPKTIALGQSREEVVLTLGQPSKIAKLVRRRSTITKI